MAHAWKNVIESRALSGGSSSSSAPVAAVATQSRQSSLSPQVSSELGIEPNKEDATQTTQYEMYVKATERLASVPDIVEHITPDVAAFLLSLSHIIEGITHREEFVEYSKTHKKKGEDSVRVRALRAARALSDSATMLDANRKNISAFQWFMQLASVLFAEENSVENIEEFVTALEEAGTECTLMQKLDMPAWKAFASPSQLRSIIWGMRRWCGVSFASVVASDDMFEQGIKMLREHKDQIESGIKITDLVIRLISGDITVDSLSGIIRQTVNLCLNEGATVTRVRKGVTHADGTKDEDQVDVLQLRTEIDRVWDNTVNPVLVHNWNTIVKMITVQKKRVIDAGHKTSTWKGKIMLGFAYARALLPLVGMCIKDDLREAIPANYLRAIEKASEVLGGISEDFLSGRCELTLASILGREDIFDLLAVIMLAVGEEKKQKFLTMVMTGKEKYGQKVADLAGEEAASALFSFGDTVCSRAGASGSGSGSNSVAGL